jgi:hypothetical protein
MKPKTLGAAVAVVVMVTAGCSNGDDDAAPVADRTTDPAGARAGATDPPEGSDQPGDGGEAGAGTSVNPLGTVRARLPATVTDPRLVPLRIDVVRLARTSDLIELEMLLTNEADPASQDPPTFTPWGTFADVPTGTDLSGLGLLVSGEQKLYLPVFDSNGRCLCSVDLSAVDVPAGESLPLNATFGGVPGDAGSLDIRIPSFPMLPDVGVRG